MTMMRTRRRRRRSMNPLQRQFRIHRTNRIRVPTPCVHEPSSSEGLSGPLERTETQGPPRTKATKWGGPGAQHRQGLEAETESIATRDDHGVSASRADHLHAWQESFGDPSASGPRVRLIRPDELSLRRITGAELWRSILCGNVLRSLRRSLRSTGWSPRRPRSITPTEQTELDATRRSSSRLGGARATVTIR
jgi:hypothetical protein